MVKICAHIVTQVLTRCCLVLLLYFDHYSVHTLCCVCMSCLCLVFFHCENILISTFVSKHSHPGSCFFVVAAAVIKLSSPTEADPHPGHAGLL